MGEEVQDFQSGDIMLISIESYRICVFFSGSGPHVPPHPLEVQDFQSGDIMLKPIESYRICVFFSGSGPHVPPHPLDLPFLWRKFVNDFLSISSNIYFGIVSLS